MALEIHYPILSNFLGPFGFGLLIRTRPQWRAYSLAVLEVFAPPTELHWLYPSMGVYDYWMEQSIIIWWTQPTPISQPCRTYEPIVHNYIVHTTKIYNHGTAHPCMANCMQVVNLLWLDVGEGCASMYIIYKQ